MPGPYYVHTYELDENDVPTNMEFRGEYSGRRMGSQSALDCAEVMAQNEGVFARVSNSEGRGLALFEPGGDVVWPEG